MTETMARVPLPVWAAVPAVLLAGIVSDAAYPDIGWWPAILLGVAGLLVALIGRRPWMAALLGFLYGMSFYLVHIEWAAVFLGPVPMVGLSVLCAAYYAIGSAGIALAYRWLPRRWPGVAGRMILLPLAVAGLWTLRESVNSVWPYGGFAWGRVGHAMIDSPVASLYAWVGVAGMTFLVVLLIAVTIEAVRFRGLPQLRRVVAPLGLIAVLLIWPVWPTPTTGELRIAVVQGNAKAGYFDARDREPGDLLAAQYLATEPLFGEVDVDLVLWPEGSSEWDPRREPYAATVWSEVSERMDAPLIAQSVVERTAPDGVVTWTNTAMLWSDGEVLDEYDKRHPVPFGEYVPDRWFFRMLAPSLIDLIQREYTPGTTDAVMDLPTAAGPVRLGIDICFDIVDDALLRESVLDGGRLLVSSSNNADFGRTDESRQQLDFARIRAVELGRAVVNASTVGITAVVDPDGTVREELPWYTVGSIVTTVPLIDTITPAAAAGQWIEWATWAIGAGLLFGAAARRWPGRGATQGVSSTS